jgi:O-antigen/teichoic acid export membrane protein
VADYSSATRLIYSLSLIPAAFTTSIFPVLSKFFAEKNEAIGMLFNKSLKFMMVLGLPIACGTTLIADKIIAFVYGQEFFQGSLIGVFEGVPFSFSSVSLQLLAWFLLLSFFNAVLLTVLNAIEKERRSSIYLASSVVLNIVLNLVLIQPLGAIGAALASIFSEIVFLALAFNALSKAGLKTFSLAGLFSKPIVIALIMSAAVVLIRDWHILIVIPLAGIVYFLALLALRVIDSEDREIIKQVTGF